MAEILQFPIEEEMVKPSFEMTVVHPSSVVTGNLKAILFIDPKPTQVCDYEFYD